MAHLIANSKCCNFIAITLNSMSDIIIYIYTLTKGILLRQNKKPER